MIITVWTRTAYANFGYLAGKAAPAEFVQLVTYKAMVHSDLIQSIDSIKAYHGGEDYIVEVRGAASSGPADRAQLDVVMPGDTPLHRAHDVSQLLQDELEKLPRVERAFGAPASSRVG